MPSANVDLVRSICADWELGDFSSAAWAHPEIEFTRADGPEAGTWRGLEGLAEGTRYRLDAWKEFRLNAVDYRELDDERVLVSGLLGGRGRRSGVQIAHIQPKAVALFHVRTSKVTRLVIYMDRDRAFADLGLSPEGTAGDPSG